MFDPVRLHEILRLDLETGALFWRARSASWFRDGFRKAQGEANNWNIRYADKQAGSIAKIGYRYISLPEGERVPEHRIVWAMIHGEWPKIIDHIDGDKLNNKPDNLRNVSQATNLRNARKWSHNRSGQTGVCRETRSGRWLAYIKVDGKDIRLGSSKDFQKAAAMRREAEAKYGFTARHGS